MSCSGTVALTIRFYAPQIEARAYATSIVFPTAAAPAASTRAEDDISLAAGGWYSSTALSVYMEYTLPANDEATSTLYALGIGNGGAVDTIGIGYTSLSTNRLLVVAGGVTQASLVNSLESNGATLKIAFAMAQDDLALSANGATQRTQTSLSMPSAATSIRIGKYPNGGGDVNVMYLKDLRFFPRRLSNAELESMVGN
jgi:hypothetical protein